MKDYLPIGTPVQMKHGEGREGEIVAHRLAYDPQNDFKYEVRWDKWETNDPLETSKHGYIFPYREGEIQTVD